VWTVLLAAAVLNCSAQGRDAPGRLEIRELLIERSGAPPAPVRVELARTGDERSRGLMHRRKLPDGEGMLFIFEKDEILSFWMKDTFIPLSVAFLTADGRIIEIHPLEPHNRWPVRSSRSARYALEVPRDWFSRAGIGVGDQLLLNGL
jgi:uncharacterized membrane protein (UPF0127 family)